MVFSHKITRSLHTWGIVYFKLITIRSFPGDTVHSIVVVFALTGEVQIHVIYGVLPVCSVLNLPVFRVQSITPGDLYPIFFQMILNEYFSEAWSESYMVVAF